MVAMATSAASPTTTPQSWRASNPPAPRRSVTLPINLVKSDSKRDDSVAQDDLNRVEVFFSHPSGKIVAFSPARPLTTSPSSAARRAIDPKTDAAGTLPWASRTEKILSAGPFRIHRAHGVAFLYAGQIIHPILAKSQCWCVDGETKFVLRIRDNSYYRIELPNDGEEDRKVADSFKEVLAKVLQYEKTACPFKRGFTVDLPEPPTTPVKIVPWKPRERPNSRDAKDGLEAERAEKSTRTPPRDSNKDKVDGSEADVTDDTIATPSRDSRLQPDETQTHLEVLGAKSRPKRLAGNRSITAPPLSIQTIYPSQAPVPPGRPEDPTNGSLSLSSSVDSFQSFHSPISPLLPSLPGSHPSSPVLSSENLRNDNFDVSRERSHSHKREISELTITPGGDSRVHDANKTPTYLEDLQSPSLPSTPPTLMSDTDDHNDPEWSEIITPSPNVGFRQQSQQPRGSSHRRPLSPLPAAANLVFPSSSLRSRGHHLTTAIIQRTCSLMLGTPLHIISLMLNIARRIRAGRFDGVFFGYGERGERIPCQWDSSDGEEGDSDGDENDEGKEAKIDAWGEDDYGISLRGIRRRGAAGAGHREDIGGSWEVD